jgi:hypothetical protein
MKNERRAAGFGGLGLGIFVALAACTGKTPAGAIQAPDPSKITVFFPVDDYVYGRGEAGAFQSGVLFVSISAYPTTTNNVVQVQPNGSFDFFLQAVSDDILEFAGASDKLGNGRGDPTYIRVPPTVLPPEAHVCCEPQGTCQRLSDALQHARCPDRQTGATQCATEADCFKEDLRVLPIKKELMRISSPNPDGHIDIQGSGVPPNALIHLENRGQRAVGGLDRGIREAKIIDVNGSFKFTNIIARGDDEIVLEVRDLQGFRSPELSILVPDAQLDSIDILGGYAYDRPQLGASNLLALRFRPRGIDGFGICPDSTESPILCFTGGLTHDMVSIDTVDYHCHSNVAIPAPEPYPNGGSLLALNRGTEGDPLSNDKRVVLIIDLSKNAYALDSAGDRMTAAEDFVRNMPKHDRLAIYSFGMGNQVQQQVDLLKRNTFCNRTLPSGMTTIMTTETTKIEFNDPTTNGLVSLTEQNNVNAAINTLEMMRMRSTSAPNVPGDSDLFPAITTAAKFLAVDSLEANALIVVVTLSNPKGAYSDPKGTEAESCSQFNDAYDATATNLDIGFPGIPVYIVSTALANPDPNLGSLSDFTGGQLNNLPGPRHTTDFFEGLQDTLGLLSGDYVLFYNVHVPCCFQTYDPVMDPLARKAGSITFTGSAHFNSPMGPAQMPAPTVTVRYPVAAPAQGSPPCVDQ